MLYNIWDRFRTVCICTGYGTSVGIEQAHCGFFGGTLVLVVKRFTPVFLAVFVFGRCTITLVVKLGASVWCTCIGCEAICIKLSRVPRLSQVYIIGL